MNVILFDDEYRNDLLPLVYTKPVAELLIGGDRISDKWRSMLNAQISFITQGYLSEKYTTNITKDNFLINGSVLPNKELCQLVKKLDYNEALLQGDDLIAARLDEAQFEKLLGDDEIDPLDGVKIDDLEIIRIRYPWELITYNKAAIKEDFERLTKNKNGQTIPAGTHVIGDVKQVFIAEGAEVLATSLNATDGPIYIGPNTLVMEGCSLRGPLYIGENVVVKMGTKIYGGTTIGRWAKAGGEIGKSILGDFSNKGHEGFLGNSIIGEWCNLGADTNTSNLKNNYDIVKLWNYREESFKRTGEQFLGTVMGDHSKCGINTMLNTGTVVGVSCNVFGSGYQPNWIASFSWGGKGAMKEYQIKKAIDTASAMMARRGKELDDIERAILFEIFALTGDFRKKTKAN